MSNEDEKVKEFLEEVDKLNKYLPYLNMKLVRDSSTDGSHCESFMLVHMQKSSLFFDEYYYGETDEEVKINRLKNNHVGWWCGDIYLDERKDLYQLKKLWGDIFGGLKVLVDKIEMLEALVPGTETKRKL